MPGKNQNQKILTNRFLWRGMSEDGATVTLRKYDGKFSSPDYFNEGWASQNSEQLRTGVALDIETTGLNLVSDKIIEIALRRFTFHRLTGEILKVDDPYTALEDPQIDLSPRVKLLTGLDNLQLAGKRIDWKLVDKELSDADIVVAHNAAFDRPFTEKCAPEAVEKIWGCSYKQIAWERSGFSTQKLDALSIFHGFFVDSHRALSDVDALLYLLSMKDGITGSPYFLELITNARRGFALIQAENSNIELKSLLRDRGYRWNTKEKFWQKQVYRDDVSSEVTWLETNVYDGPFPGAIVDLPLNGTFRK